MSESGFFLGETLSSERLLTAIPSIQYVFNEDGDPTAVIIPIEIWREISSERETAHLLSSEAMKTRLLEARTREEGIPFDVAREKLGV